jgi:hypothetical protein
MVKDNRYKAVKAMIETNGFKSFKDIFEIIPRSIVAADLGIHYNRFIDKVSKPGEFSLRDLVTLAKLIETPPMKLIELALNNIEVKKRKG